MSSTQKRILVPLVCSPWSETKLPVVEEYAQALGAELILLHVLPPPARAPLALSLPFRTQLEGPAVSPEEANARTFLDATANRLHAAGLIARTLVLYGPTAPTILEVACQQRVSLIILGSDLRHGLSRVLTNSVAGPVVQDASCPVLLVRPDERAATTTTPLRSFAEDEARAGLLTPRSLGQRRIDLARIVGSVGRADELGANFRPTLRHPPDEERYQRIVALAEEGTAPLAPIELYKLGYGYYVLDGHRRVAAAKQLGFDEIVANVTEYLPASDTTAQQLFTARRAFERETGLTSVGAASPASYPRLIALICEFQANRHLDDFKEAAARWRVTEYADLVRQIRELHLNRYFAGDRSADIIVAIADYRDAESARLHRPLTWNEAITSFTAALT